MLRRLIGSPSWDDLLRSGRQLGWPARCRAGAQTWLSLLPVGGEPPPDGPGIDAEFLGDFLGGVPSQDAWNGEEAARFQFRWRAFLELDPAVWASTQFATARLGDRRRTQRLVSLAAQVAGDPSSSLPKQTGDWSHRKGAYRLLDRPEATFQVLAAPHWQLTADQAKTGRFLVVDDTTELDFGATRQATGLGPVGSGVGRGFLLHSGPLVDPHDEWIVGLAGQILFHRRPAPKGETRAQRRARARIGRLGAVDRARRPAARTGAVDPRDGSRRRRFRGPLPGAASRGGLDRPGQEPPPPGAG